MAILARFTHVGFTADKYAETLRRLEQAGAGAPAGRLYHVCFGDKNSLRVSDIWESREAFEKFGQIVMPILHDLGVDPGVPEFIEVHNIIQGARSSSTTAR